MDAYYQNLTNASGLSQSFPRRSLIPWKIAWIDGSNNVEHCYVIQVLCPIRKYHFDDSCICFTKDADSYSFIQRLLKLPTI